MQVSIYLTKRQYDILKKETLDLNISASKYIGQMIEKNSKDNWSNFIDSIYGKYKDDPIELVLPSKDDFLEETFDDIKDL